MKNRLLVFILILLLSTAVNPVSAQTTDVPRGPIYIVQEGDTLWDIAFKFNVSVDDLVDYNNISGQDIFVGDRLVIPGLANLSGILSIRAVPFGETLRSLGRQNNVDSATLFKLNRIVSPAELYAGYGLIILQAENAALPRGCDSLEVGDTLFELAIQMATQSWVVTRLNRLNEPTTALPGDIFASPEGQSNSVPGGFPAAISRVRVDPLPISQGDTVQILVTPSENVILSGFLFDNVLNFFPTGDDSQVALQGIHAMLEPGIYPFLLTATLPDGSHQSFEQMVLLKPGNFISESLYVDAGLIDPAVTEPENQWLLSMITPITYEKLWQGLFQMPVASDLFCLRSGFGNRRTYNDGELYSFHTGLDFGICSEIHPFEIYAPARGRVLFVGEKSVRGNATIIDHGWGIFSGLWHQDEIYVSVGDVVEVGQLIGKIGATGRTTGPHLHWEIWANGIQVNPLNWLENQYPHE